MAVVAVWLNLSHQSITTTSTMVKLHGQVNSYQKALSPANFSVNTLVTLQQQEFNSINSINVTFNLFVNPESAHILNYKSYHYDSEIKLPYTESLIQLARSSNGSYMPNNYVYVNYTSVFKENKTFYGCGNTFCFNATSTSVADIYGYLSVLNFSALDGFGRGYVVNLDNVHQSNYNGYPCTYFSITRTNSSQRYQTENASICLSIKYHVPIYFSYTATSNHTKSLFLNYTVIHIDGNATQNQLDLPEPINNSELDVQP